LVRYFPLSWSRLTALEYTENFKVLGPYQSEQSLSSLADRIRSGDPRAEEEFVRMFQRRIRAFTLANGADETLAEELVQETLWAVISALRQDRVQQPDQLAAFVWGTARNLLNDRVRLRARNRTIALSPGADFPRPPHEHEAFERNHAARQAIATLERHERAVLLLSLVDGLAPDEIAQKLGILPDAVRQRKSRALKKLAEILGRRSQPPRRGLL
jgi:RNA polymerase sigma-70 factor (ECF subfamily)